MSIVDLTQYRLRREKLMIAVAGLIRANHLYEAADVREFASETVHWNYIEPDGFYYDALEGRTHDEALKWARLILSVIPGWQDALTRGSQAA